MGPATLHCAQLWEFFFCCHWRSLVFARTFRTFPRHFTNTTTLSKLFYRGCPPTSTFQATSRRSGQTCLHAIALSRCNNFLHGCLDFDFRPVSVMTLPCTVRGGVLDSYPGHPRCTSGQLRLSSSTRVRLLLPAFLCE